MAGLRIDPLGHSKAEQGFGLLAQIRQMRRLIGSGGETVSLPRLDPQPPGAVRLRLTVMIQHFPNSACPGIPARLRPQGQGLLPDPMTDEFRCFSKHATIFL